jgi:hypothetical protein
MKRAANAEEPDFPLRFGENVLVCVTGIAEFSFHDHCWLEAILIEPENEKGHFGVGIAGVLHWVERDRVQKKDTNMRPVAYKQNVLVYRVSNGRFYWKEAVVNEIPCIFLPSGLKDVDDNNQRPRCSITFVEQTSQLTVPIAHCIVARHYVVPPNPEPEKKKMKWLD